MQNNSYILKQLAWDTDFFGVASAKVDLLRGINLNDAKTLIKELRDYEFITISNHHNNSINNFWLGKETNAFLTDVNIEFELNFTENDLRDFVGQSQLTTSNYFNTENTNIFQIAIEAFNHSRFLNDPNIQEEKANQLYVNWVKNAFNKEEKFFTTINIDNENAGFIISSKSADYLVIELIATDSKYRRRKIGTTMLNGLINFAIQQNVFSIRLGTQVNNTSAINFYTKSGFRIINQSSTYHLWNR